MRISMAAIAMMAVFACSAHAQVDPMFMQWLAQQDMANQLQQMNNNQQRYMQYQDNRPAWQQRQDAWSACMNAGYSYCPR